MDWLSIETPSISTGPPGFILFDFAPISFIFSETMLSSNLSDVSKLLYPNSPFPPSSIKAFVYGIDILLFLYFGSLSNIELSSVMLFGRSSNPELLVSSGVLFSPAFY